LYGRFDIAGELAFHLFPMQWAVKHKRLVCGVFHSDYRVNDAPRFVYARMAYTTIVVRASRTGSWYMVYYGKRESINALKIVTRLPL
jgi:hypothetical protein